MTEVRSILQLAYPIIISNLTHMGLNMTDVALAGHYSADALAGLALGSTFSSFGTLIIMSTLSAIVPLVAQAEGANRPDETARALNCGIWCAILLTCAWFGITRFSYEILVGAGQLDSTAATAQLFINYVSWGYLAQGTFVVLRQFLDGLAMTRVGMVISLIELPANALLSYVLMYGRWGFPEMGIRGTGLATAVVQWCALITLALFMAFHPRFSAYRRNISLAHPDLAMLKQFLLIGIPIGIAFGMEVGVFSATALAMGWLGQTPLAAHQIALTMASTIFMVPLGVGNAGCIRVGYAKGKNDLVAIRQSGFATLGLAASFMVGAAMSLLLFADFFVSLFTDDTIVAAVSVSLLHVAAAFQIVDGLQVSGASILRGLNDTRIPMVATMIAYWLIGAPVGFVLAFKLDLGPPGLWWGLSAGLASAALFHGVRFLYLTRNQALRDGLPPAS